MGVIAGLVVAVFLLMYSHAYYRDRRFQTDPDVLTDYYQQLAETPYDGNLLLRAARHHFYVVQDKVQLGENSDELSELVIRGLSLFRRLSVVDEWHLTSRDQFKIAYFYYQLGAQYQERARNFALQAYTEGERSAELITLLANVHYRLGQYEEALKHYDSLEGGLSDPVTIFNRGWSYRFLDEPDALKKSREILRHGYQLLLEHNHADKQLRRQYILALARVKLDLSDPSTARQILNHSPGWEKDQNFLTVYAEVLMEEGRLREAIDLLEKITDLDDPPPRAAGLLEELRSE